MKRRIGVYMRASPSQGGVFQYSLGVLAACARLAQRADVDVYYHHDAWDAHRGHHPELAWHRVSCPDAWEAFLIFVARPFLPRRWMRVLHPLTWALRQPPDVMLYPSPCAQSFEIGVPYVIAVHDLQHRLQPEFPEVSAYGEAARREYLFGTACREARGILTDGEVGRDDVLRFYGVEPGRVHALPFVAPSYVDERPSGRPARLALPERYFFYPAQFWSHKNHLRLLEALAHLRDTRGLTAHLVLPGSHKYEYRAVAARVRALGLERQVQLPGYVSDEELVQLYANARALVMPTFFGPTNIPPLEAFALGCPVAISDVHGVHEQVADAALLFDPRDVPAMAAAMERLWTDDALCRDLAERGRKRAASWTRADFAERLAGIVERAAAE